MSNYALITGASGAIGRAIALELASLGKPLFLHFHRSKDQAFALKEQCESYGVPVSIIQENLSEDGGAKRLFQSLHSPIDTFIYNCGIAYHGLFQDMSEEDIYTLAHLHLLNAILLTKYLLPSMIRRQQGNIIMLSSIWGERGAACETVYSAMKGGLNTFVKALAKETARSGVRVNAIAPGAVETPMMASFSEEERNALMEEIPSGRFANPEEIADAVRFLISPKASYINGHILQMNGAW